MEYRIFMSGMQEDGFSRSGEFGAIRWRSRRMEDDALSWVVSGGCGESGGNFQQFGKGAANYGTIPHIDLQQTRRKKDEQT
jgi:hypothetical protein